MFNLHLFSQTDSIDWTSEVKTVNKDENFLYEQRIEPSKAGYYRGVQIIRPSSPNSSFSWADNEWTGCNKENKYVEFTAWDWRHKYTVAISTDPSATTSYFVTENDLPFTTSPAFFRPEVMSKYKNDPDQYTIDEERETISCRGSWSLRSYGVNEAGQVYAYICDLALLPSSELQYWKSFNEEPKAGISQRSLTNDFEGKFSDITTPWKTCCPLCGDGQL